MANDSLSSFTQAVHAEIRGWVAKKNISQRLLAEKAGISKSKLSRMIGTNEQAIDTDELDAICQVLRVSPEKVVEDAVRAIESAEREAERAQRPVVVQSQETQGDYARAAKHRPHGPEPREEDYF